MSLLSEFARLRPMMPFASLAGRIGAECRPSRAGWLHLGCRASVRVDAQGRIGTLRFHERFPAAVLVDGLQIGMTLDELIGSGHGFRRCGPRSFPFTRTDYVGRMAEGEAIRARVDADGLVRELEIARPGLPYPAGAPVGNDTVPLSPFAYRNDAEMLLEWASGFTFDDGHHMALARWLRFAAGPDDWHAMARRWNWENGVEPLLWVIRQAACDAATALHVFHHTRPGRFLAHADGVLPAGLRDAFDLAGEIRQRFMGGFYTRSLIAFDAGYAFERIACIPNDACEADMAALIPAEMRRRRTGRDIGTGRFCPPESVRRVSVLRPPALSDAERRELREVERQAARKAAWAEAARRCAPDGHGGGAWAPARAVCLDWL